MDLFYEKIQLNRITLIGKFLGKRQTGGKGRSVAPVYFCLETYTNRASKMMPKLARRKVVGPRSGADGLFEPVRRSRTELQLSKV